jgi:hypothetical protein
VLPGDMRSKCRMPRKSMWRNTSMPERCVCRRSVCRCDVSRDGADLSGWSVLWGEGADGTRSENRAGLPSWRQAGYNGATRDPASNDQSSRKHLQEWKLSSHCRHLFHCTKKWFVSAFSATLFAPSFCHPKKIIPYMPGFCPFFSKRDDLFRLLFILFHLLFTACLDRYVSSLLII